MIIFLFSIILILLIYIFHIKTQIKNIINQLRKREEEKSDKIISLALLDKELILLSSEINETIENGKNIARQIYHKEKEFKNMIANLSHDSRTPLTAVKGNLQILEKSRLSKEQKEQLEVIYKNLSKLEKSINDFWKYSYYSVSENKMNLEKINLTNLITESLASYFL